MLVYLVTGSALLVMQWSSFDCQHRLIAEMSGVALVEVRLPSVVSKWFGESEKILDQVFNQSKRLGPTIIFLDEIDALAVSR